MKAFIAVGIMASVATAGAAVQASKVCVQNSGGYDLYFWFTDLNSGESSAVSDTYPIDQLRCMDIAIYGLAEGDFV